MKKKLSLMLCLCFMVLAMTACGTDPKSVDYFGMSYSDIQDNMEQTVSALVSFSDEDIQSGAEYYDSNGMDAFAHLLTSWGETVSDLGSYQGLGDLTVTKAQKTVTADQVLHFSDRDVVVSYVYEYNYETEAPELTDASADLVYSLGEKMGKAGMNTLMGMGTVFVMLIFISLLISLFGYIPKLEEKIKNIGKKPEPVKTEEPAAVVEEPQTQVVNLQKDEQLVAVITAAIMASYGINAVSADKLVVRSIHRVDGRRA